MGRGGVFLGFLGLRPARGGGDSLPGGLFVTSWYLVLCKAGLQAIDRIRLSGTGEGVKVPFQGAEGYRSVEFVDAPKRKFLWNSKAVHGTAPCYLEIS